MLAFALVIAAAVAFTAVANSYYVFIMATLALTAIVRFGKYRQITFETCEPVDQLKLSEGVEILKNGDVPHERQLMLRFDRNIKSASQVVVEIMEQVEVVDFSLKPSLSSIIKQIYTGALDEGAMP